MAHIAAVTDRKSAQMDETINDLLHLKDDITSKLLEQTKLSADLTQIQSCAEEQLREAFESSLHNIRKEFVKKRKKIVPVVKQFEAASSSLAKAERSLQCEPRSSGSVVKKSRRRMRAARQILLESTVCTGDIFPSVRRCVNEEITFLREKLIDIIDILNKTVSKLQSNNADYENLSDSDSDFSVDGSLNVSREKQYIPKQSVITHSNAKIDVLNKTQEKHYTSPPKSKTAQLNGVDLFTSESDSDEKFDTGKYIPIGPFKIADTIDPKRGTIQKVSPISLEYAATNKNALRRDKNNYDKNTNVENGRERNTTFNRKPDTCSMTADRNLNLTDDSICETKIVNRLSRRDQTIFTPSPRTSQKRVLPSVPTKSNSDQTPQFSRRSSEKCNKDNTERLSHENDRLYKSSYFKTNTFSESFDVEEFEFKETIKNTRQQILDKIKSKYHVSTGHQFLTSTVDLDDTCTLLEPCSSIFSDSLDATLTSNKDSGVDMKDSDGRFDEKIDIREHTTIHDKDRYTQNKKHAWAADDSNTTITDTTLDISQNSTLTDTINSNKSATLHDHPVYNWKRVEISKRNETSDYYTTRDNSSLTPVKQESKVSQTIQKYETVSNGSNMVANTPDTFRYSRSRSVTGPRIKHDRSFVKNKALQPRSGNDRSFNTPKTLNDSNCGNHSIPFKRQHSTESNLNEICERDSRKAIRDVWRHRRSISLTSTTPRVKENNVITKSEYKLISTFVLPNHNSKCHVSGIIVLSNDFIVCLDEIHCCLVLFNTEHKYLNQYDIMDVPSGITALHGKSFGISYPFRSKIGIFKEHGCAVVHERDISVTCKEWVTDLCFEQNAFYVLCKGGHIHVISQAGSEIKRLIVDVNGKLTINQTAKRIYITGSGQVTRFDSDGNEVSRKSDISALNTIIIGDVAYIGDRRKHKIVPLSDKTDYSALITDKVDYPSAICVHRNCLYVSSFEETLNDNTTRTIKVYKSNILS